MNEHLEIMLDNKEIKVEQIREFLELTIDLNIKFVNHIEYIGTKVSRSVGIFCKWKDIVPSKMLVNLYYSLVYPYLIYGNLL